MSIPYVLLALAAVCVAGVPLAFYSYFQFGGYWPIAGFVAGGVLSGLPIDKMIDEKYRTLQNFGDEKTA